jgi:replicative DNA helicase
MTTQPPRGERRRWPEEHDLICAVIWHEDAKTARTMDPDIFQDWRDEWDWLVEFVTRNRCTPKPKTIDKQFEDFEFQVCNEPVSYYLAAVQRRNRYRDLALGGGRAVDRLLEDDPEGAAAELQQTLDQLRAAQSVQYAESNSADTADSTWESPAAFGTARQPGTFPADALPDWLAAYVAAEATATQTPPDLPGMLALATLAASSGGLVEVEVRRGWLEPTQLFVVVAMTPGARKSAVFRDVTRPLVDLERELDDKRAPDVLRKEVERDVARQVADKAKDRAGKGKPEQAADLLANAVAAAQLASGVEVPIMPRLLADDATPEALASLLADQGGRIALLSPEGGIFDMMAGRYGSGGMPNLDHYLKGHAGDPIRVDRKGRPPEHIDRPALTVGLAVQPDVLRLIADRPGFKGRGLLARFLWSLPPSTVGRREVGAAPVPADVGATYYANMLHLARELLTQAKIAEGAGEADPMVLTLDDDAQAAMIEFERELEGRLHPETGDLAGIEGWAAKLAGATARIATLLYLAQDVQIGWLGPIPGESVRSAVRIARYLIDHALGAFDMMGADPALADARYVLEWITRTGAESFTARELFSKLPRGRFRKMGDLTPALALLDAHGYVRKMAQPDQVKAGRPPSPRYVVNPRITRT